MPPQLPSASWWDEDPLLGSLAGARAQRMVRQPLVAPHHRVEGEEETIEQVARRARRRAFDVKLVEPGRVRDGPHRPIVHQQEQRDDGAARPGGEPVDAQRSRGRQQHQLRRHRRQIVPAPLAEERQPDAGEGPRARDPAALADEGARARHVGRGHGIAGQLEREVAFDAGGEIAGSAVVHRPAAVVALVIADVPGHRRASAPPRARRGNA